VIKPTAETPTSELYLSVADLDLARKPIKKEEIKLNLNGNTKRY
jgi:hypothetical protein